MNQESSQQPNDVDASRSAACSTALLPIVDIAETPLCEDYDSDCGSMSLGDVECCMNGWIVEINGELYGPDPISGICPEMQSRQVGR